MERLNELQVFRADGDRARGFKTVLVSEADHPFWQHWWPPGHIIGWGETFVHELHHLLERDRRRRRRRPARRDLRGRLSRGGGLRRDRPLERERPPRDPLLPVAGVAARCRDPSRSSPASGPTCRSRNPRRRRGEWGFDGLELACWGDHFEVDRALASRLLRREAALLEQHGLQCWALGAHLVGQAVCDPIDARHEAILPPGVWGDGDRRVCAAAPRNGCRTPPAPPHASASRR